MRSEVGVAWPFTRREFFLEDTFPDLEVRDFVAAGFADGEAGTAEFTDLVVPEDLAWALLCVLVEFADFFEALWAAPAAGSVKPPAARAARIA
jgi:hypothetical protein